MSAGNWAVRPRADRIVRVNRMTAGIGCESGSFPPQPASLPISEKEVELTRRNELSGIVPTFRTENWENQRALVSGKMGDYTA